MVVGVGFRTAQRVFTTPRTHTIAAARSGLQPMITRSLHSPTLAKPICPSRVLHQPPAPRFFHSVTLKGTSSVLPTKCAKTLNYHEQHVTSLATLPDGSLASGSIDGVIMVKQVHKDTPPFTLLKDPTIGISRIADLRLVASGKYLAAAACKNRPDIGVVPVFNLETLKRATILEGPKGAVTALGCLKDGKIIGSSQDNHLRVWTLSIFPINTFPAGYISSIRILDGQFAACAQSSFITCWDPISAKQICERFTHDGPVFALAVCPDERTLVSGSEDTTIRIWDYTLKNPLLQMIKTPSVITALTVFSDGTIISGHFDGNIFFWDPKTGKKIEPSLPKEHNEAVTALSLLLDGTLCSASREIKWWTP